MIGLESIFLLKKSLKKSILTKKCPFIFFAPCYYSSVKSTYHLSLKLSQTPNSISSAGAVKGNQKMSRTKGGSTPNYINPGSKSN